MDEELSSIEVNRNIEAKEVATQQNEINADSTSYNNEYAVFVWGFGDIRLGLGKQETEWYGASGRTQTFRHQFIPRLHRPLSTIRRIHYASSEAPENEEKNSTASRFTSVHSAALGVEHGLALSIDQRVFVWGRNNYGQLGYRKTLKLQTYTDLYSPTEIVYLKGTVQVAAGNRFSMALRSTGELYTWGII